jgi:hypothetical protein
VFTARYGLDLYVCGVIEVNFSRLVFSAQNLLVPPYCLKFMQGRYFPRFS